MGVGADHFAYKSIFRYSQQLTVDYHKNYKHVRFLSRGNAEEDNWYLVQRGTPTPSVPFGSKVVMAPVQRLAVGTFRYAGAIELLGVAPSIVAYGNHQNITVSTLRQPSDLESEMPVPPFEKEFSGRRASHRKSTEHKGLCCEPKRLSTGLPFLPYQTDAFRLLQLLLGNNEFTEVTTENLPCTLQGSPRAPKRTHWGTVRT